MFQIYPHNIRFLQRSLSFVTHTSFIHFNTNHLPCDALEPCVLVLKIIGNCNMRMVQRPKI